MNLEGQRYYAVSWFSQQATEKALKAALLDRTGTEPPKIHDLLTLGRRIGAPQEIMQGLDILNPVFSVVRYPRVGEQAPVDLITRGHAIKHIDAAREVVRWVESQLQP